MLVRINLLPAGLLAQRDQKRARRRFFLAWSLIVVVLLAAQGYLYITIQGVTEELNAVAQERAVVDAQIANYTPYVQLQSRVNAGVTRLQRAMGAPLEWAEVVAEVGEHIPPNVWLTDVTLSQPAGSAGGGTAPGLLTLRGLTYDHPSTASWVIALRDLTGATDVFVMFSQTEGQEEDELVRFEIKVTLLPGPLYDPLAQGGERS